MNAVDLPRRMRSLPQDARGFPVPWFVVWADGKPDFRCVAPGKVEDAIRHNLCWVCGEPLGRFLSFVTGPLCAVNGTAAEPPAHHDCGLYSACTCPFLTKPRMRRNDKDLSYADAHPAGSMIERNPGVTLLWTTRSFKAVSTNGGVMFRVGPATSIEWFAQGRAAGRAEVLHSLEDGIGHLQKLAKDESPEAERALETLYRAALRLLPAEP